jgi:ABC-type branched-subunit amino acid transport system substrate-binding protein
VIALSACLALLVAAPDAGVVKIGGLYPLTGGYAATGIAMRNGARLAVAEVNAAGGLLGKKLALVDADDASKPEQAVALMKDLLDKEGVVALVGPANTGVGAAAGKLANERRVPLVVSNAVGNKVNELSKETPQNFVFRIAASEALQAQMMVTEACAARGKRKPAILADETATVEPAPGAAQTYDAVHLLAKAIRQAGATAPDQVRTALESLKGTYEGATAEYDQPWNTDDHEAVSPAAVVWGTLKDGKIVPR